MSDFKDRMTDAEFGIKAMLCLSCMNEIDQEWSEREPLKPLSICKILGDIPRDIDMCNSYKCKHFILNEENYKINKELMPKDFDPYKI